MSALSPLLIFLIARILILIPNFDTEHFFDDVIGVSMNIGNTLRRIKFWASENQSKYIHTRPIRSSQRLLRENPKDGSCVLSIDVVIYFEMYSSFLFFGPGVRILYVRKVVFRPASKGSGNVCRGGVGRRRFGGRQG